MPDKIQKEKDFHNNRFEKETRDSLSKYYSISYLIDSYYYKKLFEDSKNKKVLEFGSGLGVTSFKLAELANEVHSIDISEVAITKAKEKANDNSINNLFFYVMNAESLQFPDNYFDVVCGTAILHHLDLNMAYAELSRVLKPTGKIIFIEPLGHNPLINLYRRATKHLRTEDEHPLLKNDIKLLEKFFSNTTIKYYFLLSLLAVPFRNKNIFLKILKYLNSIDQKLFKLNFFKSQAWQVVIEAFNPVK